MVKNNEAGTKVSNKIIVINKDRKVSNKIIAVINKDRKWYPAYSKGEIMAAGERFEVRGDRYIDATGVLVLENYVGHGWHETVKPEDFDLFFEETVTVITKTVTSKRATFNGKHIVPVVAEAAE